MAGLSLRSDGQDSELRQMESGDVGSISGLLSEANFISVGSSLWVLSSTGKGGDILSLGLGMISLKSNGEEIADRSGP